jgi:hypothetical protein
MLATISRDTRTICAISDSSSLCKSSAIISPEAAFEDAASSDKWELCQLASKHGKVISCSTPSRISPKTLSYPAKPLILCCPQYFQESQSTPRNHVWAWAWLYSWNTPGRPSLDPPRGFSSSILAKSPMVPTPTLTIVDSVHHLHRRKSLSQCENHGLLSRHSRILSSTTHSNKYYQASDLISQKDLGCSLRHRFYLRRLFLSILFISHNLPLQSPKPLPRLLLLSPSRYCFTNLSVYSFAVSSSLQDIGVVS